MASELSFGELEPSPGAGDRAPVAESPFRIAVLGDFSGRANRGEKSNSDELKARKPRLIDGENFEDEMTRFKVRVEAPLPDSDETVSLAFPTLDEFDPDEIYNEVDQFDDCDDAAQRSALMNAILHHPDVRAIEAAWRGLDWLVKRALKKDVRAEILLYDISFEELADDLKSSDNLADTALHHLLIEQATQGPKGEAWALLLGNYAFDVTTAHIELLGRMAQIARQASVPFLADAHPRLHDKDNHPDEAMLEQWQALRQLPEASLLGLSIGRFLLRVPYGENTRSIERFSYEEFTGPDDDCYLLGSAAFGCAALLGMSFIKDGWSFKPGATLDLDKVPLHAWRDQDGDDQMTTAEVWLKKPDVQRLAGLGLMPWLCIKNKDGLQLLRFQSLAQPAEGQEASELMGRWGQEGVVQLPRTGLPSVSVGMGVGAPPSGKVASASAPPAVRGSDAADDDESDDEAGFDDATSMGNDDLGSGGGDEDEMDPELAALMAEMEGGGEASDEVGGDEDEMDPELAALMAEMEGGGEAGDEVGGDDEMDPELAALMAEMEGGGDEPENTAEEEMDPELAALMASLEEGNDEPEGASDDTVMETGDEEEMDPELAALMASLEEGGGDSPATDEPNEIGGETEETDDEEVDPELAALMASLEGSGEEETNESNNFDEQITGGGDGETDPELAALMASLGEGAGENTAAEESAGDDDEVDPELAALMGELEDTAESAGDEAAVADSDATPELDNGQLQQVEELGGRAALEDLGWPVFVPAFAENLRFQIDVLQNSRQNPAAQEEIDKLVKKCGGYDRISEHGVSPDMGLNAQLNILRDIARDVELQGNSSNNEIEVMARAYGVRLEEAADEDSHKALVRQINEFDRWVHDPRHLDTLSALEGLSFEEKRRIQLLHQFSILGGEEAWAQWVSEHPMDAGGDLLEQQVHLLKMLREYNRLGGEDVFRARAAGSSTKDLPLADKLRMLRAILTIE